MRPLFATVTGYLFITGRIKEILITRGGENVAPVPIEEKMKETMKLLSYCVVIGDNQKFLTMFVTLRCEVRHYSSRLALFPGSPMCECKFEKKAESLGYFVP